MSWILPPLAQCEHPAAPPGYGEDLIHSVLSTLVSNPAVWAQTVLFVTHDENGGFFDHVPPLTPPPGTEGEWLTGNLPAAAGGITGPVGFGFRVPALVISPFSRGGYVCSQLFDHTSLLRFIETRFGVEVPNLSPWRRSVTGDLTAALALSRPPDPSVPALPPPRSARPASPSRRCSTPGRHPRPGHQLPAAHGQRHAVPGDQPESPARALRRARG